MDVLKEDDTKKIVRNDDGRKDEDEGTCTSIVNENNTTITKSTKDSLSSKNDTQPELKTFNLDDAVPQFIHDNITYRDLETTIRVLKSVATLNSTKNNKINNNNNDDKNNSSNNNKKRNRNVNATSTNVDTSLTENGKEQRRIKNDVDENDCQQKHQHQQQQQEKVDGLELYKQSNLRHFRKAIASVIELHRRSMYDGLDEEVYYQQRCYERTLKRQRIAETDQQHNFIAKTALRKGRIDRLNQLQQIDGFDEEIQKHKIAAQQYMIPDGYVDTTTTLTITTASQQQPAHVRQLPTSDDTEIEKVGNDEKNNNNNTLANPSAAATTIRLPKLRSCYVCKVRYRELHTFYDQLCPSCADLNWTKRHQTCNLTGWVAVVTGSRVKIGYQTCLKLLRAGCTVIATTRFPNSAVESYRKEVDFNTFADRLQVYGLDLRDVTGLEAFTRYLKLKYYNTGGIGILINNACQTIRRPTAYYIPAVQMEQQIWDNADDTHKSLLAGCYEFERIRRSILLEHQRNSTSLAEVFNPQLQIQDTKNETSIDEKIDTHGKQSTQIGSTHEQQKTSTAIVSTSDNSEITTSTTHFEKSGISHSAAMSQMILLNEDVGVSADILPTGVTDVNGQQLDLRKQNSWLLKMEEVSTPELMECMFVNAIAPFVLNARLKPLMTVPDTDDRPDRYIINVSAMEGKFYRYKTECHPHTNMAKAALNMLTRTSADSLAKNDRIYMNSVDTGWINDENPLEKASRIAKVNKFQTPIDEIDAAARILDPIFTGVNSNNNNNNTTNGTKVEQVYGKFLKDYKESEW